MYTKRKQYLSAAAATAEILHMFEENSESDSDDLDNYMMTMKVVN